MNTLNNVRYVSDIEELSFQDSFLILSSVLHEIYSFETYPEIYFTKYFKLCKLIAIRDMMFTENKNVAELEGEKIQEIHLGSNELFGKFVEDAIDSNKENLPIKFHKKFISHYLLKSLYEDNFEEELKENYFSTDYQYINYLLLHSYDFKKSYYQEYLNSYLRSKVKELHKLDLKQFTHTTHCKIIYKRY